MRTAAKSIEALLAPFDRKDAPGCAVGVFEHGALAFACGSGMASLEYDAPITTRTVFRIASTSKQFTAAVILDLADRGLVDLDGDIRSWVPEIPGYVSPITVRHLIHHTSGLRDYLSLTYLPGMDPRAWVTEEEIIDLLARQRGLNFDPGERFLYCNSGYFLLSVIARRASGLTLRELAEERLFGPLDMVETHFHDDHTEVVRHRAQGYARDRDGGYSIDMSTSDIVGDGGAFTTVEDLFLWYRGLREDRLGAAAPGFVPRLIEPGRLNDGRPILYAFGLFVSRYRGLWLVSHSGSFAGFRAEMLWFPERDVAVVCLANLAGLSAPQLARQVADAWLEGVLPEPAVPLPEVERPFVELPDSVLESREGVFQNQVTGNIWELTAEDGRLVAGELGGETHELQAAGPDRFVALSAPTVLEFRFLDEGESLGLTVRAEIERPYRLEEIEPAEPSREDLADCVGCYRCDELDLIYGIVLGQGGLLLEVSGEPGELLRPVVEELFRLEDMTFRFRRDGSDRVTALVLSGCRVRGIVFERMEE